MKKMLAVLSVVSIIFTVGFSFAAYAGGVTVTVNGQPIVSDVSPVIENGRILLPMRTIFEKLGCSVSYRTEGDKQYVTALRGEKYVMLEIGKNEITVNGDIKPLDAFAKIENGRTLIPVRAVSEAMGAAVSWDEKTSTAEITTKQGDRKISAVTYENTVKDGDTVLMYINYAYPVIENTNNNEYIAKINEEYKAYAEKFASGAQSNVSDAKELLAVMGKDSYRPMEYNLSYEIQTDKGGILSISNYEYYNLGGAHPNSAIISRTFDLESCRELAAADILDGSKQEQHKMIYNAFEKYFKENIGRLSAEEAENLDKECDNIKFYLTDDSAVLYFDVYQVAPYAVGYPTITVPYSAGTKISKL